MCEGFGLIVTNELKAYFCEPDLDGDCSHSEILGRLGWKDNTNQFVRRFVRVQCPDWEITSFEFDERGTQPGWAEENEDAIKTLVELVLSRCAPAFAEFERVRDAAYAEFEKVRVPAYAEYERVYALAFAEYKKVREAAYSDMIAKLSSISGYVAKPAERGG
jgi:hypothetical protein